MFPATIFINRVRYLFGSGSSTYARTYAQRGRGGVKPNAYDCVQGGRVVSRKGGYIEVRVHKGGSSQLRTIAYNGGGRWDLIFEIFVLTYYVTQ